MGLTRWEYEAFTIHKAGEPTSPAGPDEIKQILNRFGDQGYQIIHLKEKENGTLFFILGRDTGRPPDEDKSHEWLVEAVTTDQNLGM